MPPYTFPELHTRNQKLSLNLATELSNSISITVFCGIVKVTFIKLCYHGEHKESII